ncbi:MAG TPA: GatB/YqeY domain-containing protein [Usitatibacter sp.]|nr:GatB/YqeY domain-containing protein [Usitatibacter sp.]
MPLRDQLNDDLKAAMKAREADRLAALRLMLAAVKQREIDERVTLDDAGVIAVVEKMIKQRKDSIAQYEKAARRDLADRERFEISVIEAYLPKQMSPDEVEAAVAETRKALEADDAEAIRKSTEALGQAVQKIGGAMYAQGEQAAQGAPPEPGPAPEGEGTPPGSEAGGGGESGSA